MPNDSFSRKWFLGIFHPICYICVTIVPNDSFSGKSFLSFFLRSNLALVPIREPQGREGKLLGNQEDLTEDLTAVLYSVPRTALLYWTQYSALRTSLLYCTQYSAPRTSVQSTTGKSHYICNQHNDNPCFQYWKNCKKYSSSCKTVEKLRAKHISEITLHISHQHSCFQENIKRANISK